MEQDKHEEGARHRFASEHDERQGQSLEEAAQKKKGRGKIVFGFFGKLSLKAKLAVFAAAAAIAFGFVLPWMADNHETHYLAKSDLKSAVDIDSLSTIDSPTTASPRSTVSSSGRIAWTIALNTRPTFAHPTR